MWEELASDLAHSGLVLTALPQQQGSQVTEGSEEGWVVSNEGGGAHPPPLPSLI